eukprot:Nitzschia sp. Nitz4//scaffold267_size26297//865//1728//NITZ4_008263-RA/size26297-exonerate_protein2genome-gene-0.7-mRNA-1//-1//CDS//3329544887//9148//frame0
MSSQHDSTSEISGKQVPTHCFFKVSIAGESQNKPIVIQLRQSECPQICLNFVTLCSSKETTNRKNPKPTYRGCDFHRIIDNFMVQAGDFEKFDGSGGYSPLCGKGMTLPDENLKGVHDKEGIVSMANKGKNTNGSQFFITLKATSHLDSKHVVFGTVVQGMSVVNQMLGVERINDRPVPLQRVTIVDCGVGWGDEPTTNDAGILDSVAKPRERSSKRRKKHRPSRHDDESSSDDGRHIHKRHKKHRRRPDSDDSSEDSYKQRKRRHKSHRHHRSSSTRKARHKHDEK